MHVGPVPFQPVLSMFWNLRYVYCFSSDGLGTNECRQFHIRRNGTCSMFVLIGWIHSGTWDSISALQNSMSTSSERSVQWSVCSKILEQGRCCSPALNFFPEADLSLPALSFLVKDLYLPPPVSMEQYQRQSAFNIFSGT